MGLLFLLLIAKQQTFNHKLRIFIGQHTNDAV